MGGGWGRDNNVRCRCSIQVVSHGLFPGKVLIYDVPSMLSFKCIMLGTVSFPSSACVVYRSFPGLSMVLCSFLSALFLAFIWLGHWTGVDEVPHLLKGWFEADPSTLIAC